MLGQYQRQGIGLLAAGAARAPDGQTLPEPGSARSGELRQGLGSQELEVRRLPEKVGLVGGDDVDQMDELLLGAGAAEEVLGVFRERTEAELAKPLLEARLEHRLLRRGHLDAALAVDECAEAGEIPVCH
jgi:hypothetical protein